MSMFGQRNIAATHKRVTTVPDGVNDVATLGIVCIGFAEETFFEQGEDGLTAPTAEFPIFFDPDDDLRPGDLLEFSGELHEIKFVRRFPTSKRNDHAEADIVRKEVLK